MRECPRCDGHGWVATGADLRAWRLSHGYTLQEVAELGDVTPQSVSNFESRETIPRWIVLEMEIDPAPVLGPETKDSAQMSAVLARFYDADAILGSTYRRPSVPAEGQEEEGR